MKYHDQVGFINPTSKEIWMSLNRVKTSNLNFMYGMCCCTYPEMCYGFTVVHC